MSGDYVSFINQSAPIDVSQSYDPSTLHHKNILITGGANGLGAVMVRQWASHGANILIADLDVTAGEALVAELRTKHQDSTFLFQRCDVTDWDDQVAMFDAAVGGLPGGGLDVVVPNAGILLAGTNQRFEDPQPGADGKLPKPNLAVFDVNVTGVWYTTHLALYHLPRNPQPNGDRCLLLVGSLASIMAFAGQAQYTTSKHAVLGLFRTIRSTASIQHGIRVNMILPYYVNGTGVCPVSAELMLLAGGTPEGGTSAADVVDAATRLAADEGIRGRALAIGPRIKELVEESDVKDLENVIPPLTLDEVRNGGRAVWEVYADDYKQLDTWVGRWLLIVNTLTVARGYFRWFKDAFAIWRR
ncbi:short chain dehydrogenase domain-containing protein [Sarocladium implicatum]|nr:short chain dehydrogenase domain-containing protein [Sarocladium implicatum]